MSSKSIAAFQRYLFDREQECLKRALEAESRNQLGTALYCRTMAAECRMEYAWLDGDDTAQVLAHQDKEKLRQAVERVDRELLDNQVAAQLAQIRSAA